MPQPHRSSGSDHKRSHIGPSWGTSWTRSRLRTLSRFSIDGDKPPWRQKISDSTFKQNINIVSVIHGQKMLWYWENARDTAILWCSTTVNSNYDCRDRTKTQNFWCIIRIYHHFQCSNNQFIQLQRGRHIFNFQWRLTSNHNVTKLCSIEQSATTTQPILLVLQNKSKRSSKYKKQTETAT